MMGLLEPLVRPLLRLLDAESAHRLAIAALKIPPFVKLTADDPRLTVRAFGLNFPNPVGMAAGFDKHAEVPDAVLALGFGFVEVGTVTLRPQAGNPRPRVFRLPRDEGVINRLGFNSEGAEVVLRRLAARADRGGIVGINIGANKESTDRIGDYVRLIETFAAQAIERAEAKQHCAPHLAALGLLLNRAPLYAGPETVVAADFVAQAYAAFQHFNWAEPELMECCNLFLRAARVVNDRNLDVPKPLRNQIARKLESAGVAPIRTATIKGFTPVGRIDRASLYGEPLPPGLVLGADLN